jgi:hypothetical protein
MDATLAGVDADMVYETPHGRIWVGSHREKNNDTTQRLRRLDIGGWLRVARELDHDYGLDDGALTEAQLVTAKAARNAGIHFLKSKRGDLLVTCHLGANRSAFVTALIARKLTGESGSQIFERIRTRRTVRVAPQLKALSNKSFVDFLMRYP